MKMRYISIVGTSGVGKSTLARQLARQLNLNYIELDNLLWLDNWQETPDDQFLAKLNQHMQQSQAGWVIDNLYTRAENTIWSQADTIIWLDYSFTLNFYRLLRRTLANAINRRQLWPDSNNQESWKMMLSRKSIFIWMIQKYPKNRQKYQAMMHDPQYAHLQFVHLASSKQAKLFLKQI